MDELLHTPLDERHRALGARMVPFGGWEMPLQYPSGVVAEHLATRRSAGLFDVSHMGRFAVGGADAVPFLQTVLSNNVEQLDLRESHYTLIPTPTGGALDDAYLYRFVADEYLLVVNASNRAADWTHLVHHANAFDHVELRDDTAGTAMMALQGPTSRGILERVLEEGRLPEPMRNELAAVRVAGAAVGVARTGYTGEPLCFELFTGAVDAPAVWDRLAGAGATPCGLAARDTLRLEAGLPLYGHELGADPDGVEIPCFALAFAKTAVSFSPVKGDYVGRAPLGVQHDAFERIVRRDYSKRADLPRLIQPVALLGPGIARAGAPVFKGDRPVGWVTSGTRVPYWVFDGDGLDARITDDHALRSICLAYLDCDLVWDDRVEVEIRGKRVAAVVVEFHLRSEAPPHARPIVQGYEPEEPAAPEGRLPALVRGLLERAEGNHRWRQERCINLIPSEMTPSPLARLVSVMDPAFRYAEHKEVEAFYDTDVFYYQGTDFIAEVERLVVAELARYLGCAEVEARVLSGQMANTVVFSAMVDYLNRADPKRELRRMGYVVNNHILRGGHLSAQAMGALRDFVARDPLLDRAAVEEFPVLADNPYRIDLPEAYKVIERVRPELIVLGKSMVLHPEPVAELRWFLDDQGLDGVLMYDMAHVLGLVGPHFQSPFAEGADVVTGSTHKTFFGPQRGLVAVDWEEHEERYELWEAIQRRTFPGSLSNHHLGTLVGLLVAAYEMNHFKDDYQPAVLANAKSFARALADCGLSVDGDASVGYTETHQVIVRVGYGRGPEVARRLEDNGLIVNYQAAPDEEGFTAAGALRLGVAEMTRFGMGPDGFAEVAQLIRDVILDDSHVADRVARLREPYRELRYCFDEAQYADVLQRLRGWL